MVLFPIALVWLAFVLYWAIRRAAAEPTDEPPTRWWSRPRLPRGGGPRRSPEGTRASRRARSARS